MSAPADPAPEVALQSPDEPLAGPGGAGAAGAAGGVGAEPTLVPVESEGSAPPITSALAGAPIAGAPIGAAHTLLPEDAPIAGAPIGAAHALLPEDAPFAGAAIGAAHTLLPEDAPIEGAAIGAAHTLLPEDRAAPAGAGASTLLREASTAAPPPWHGRSAPARVDPRSAPCASTCAPRDEPREVGPGSVLAARYEVVQPIGQGGMGAVHLAVDRMLRRTVAVKVMRRAVADRADLRARFVREAQATAQLEHPGIVPVHDFGATPDGKPFFVMKLVRGRTLAEVIDQARGGARARGDASAAPSRGAGSEAPADEGRARGEAAATLAPGAPAPADTQPDRAPEPFNAFRLMQAFLEVARAIAYAHQRGVIHRDLKPQNVMIGPYGEVQVMDWGLAKVLGDPHSETAADLEVDGAADMTRVGAIVGTPAYMAPEQAAGELDAVDQRADVYALGAILYQLLTGEPPFRGRASHEILACIATGGGPARPRALDPAIQPALEAICLRAMAPRPQDRYPSAHALAEDVQAYLENRPAREALLAEARAGALIDRPGAYEDALFKLVGYRDARTVELLGAALDEIADALRAVARRLLAAAARPTPDEAQAGLGDIAGLADALDEAYAASSSGRAAPGLRFEGGPLAEAARRLEDREARERSYLARARTPSAREILAGAQGRALGPGPVQLARLCCEALGRLGIVEGAVAPLARYLLAEEDERRASVAAVALTLLGGEDALRPVRAARARFGPNSGFWTEVSRSYRRAGGEAPLEEHSATGYVERGAARRESGDLDGALDDLARAAALDPDDARAWALLAMVRAERGDPAGALADYERALALAPGDPAVWLNRARARADAGDPEGAVADAGHAIGLAPDLAWAWLVRGVLEQERGAIDRAAADYERAVALDPALAVAWTNLGDARRRQGALEPAAAALDHALALDPGDPRAWRLRGLVRARRGEHAGALEDLSRALELDASDVAAWIERGRARAAAGDLDGALGDLDRALALDPDREEALAARGLARQAKGDLAGAIADLARAAARAPTAAALADLGAARQAQGDLAGAIADYGSALALDERAAAAWRNRGDARRLAGDLDGAIADLGRAIELAPGDAYAWNARAAAWRARGDLARADRDLTRSLELDPDKGAAWTNRAEVRRALGRAAEAALDAERAVELQPRASPGWRVRASALMELGRLDEAVLCATRALELDPRDGAAWNIRAVAHQAGGDLAAATADLSRALELDPADPTLWTNRAIARTEAGDLAGAIADCDRALALDPRSAPAWNNRGFARYEQGDLDGAVEDATRAIGLDPLLACAWETRGDALAARGDRARAIADLARFIELEPDHARSANARARIAELRAEAPPAEPA